MSKKVNVYAPGYYEKFVCIADKCIHSCCVGWDVYIDDETMKKYLALDSEYADKIRSSIEGGNEPRFRMCADGRCPHLDSDGLCRIIINEGEEYLSGICREHPRFYNVSSRGVEIGLGMACEEAARIILSSDDYSRFFIIGEAEAALDAAEFDAMAEVGQVLDILSNEGVDYPRRLALIYERCGVSPAQLSDGEWRELISELEYLDAEDRNLFAVYSSELTSPTVNDKLLERALAYFVYRHCVSAGAEGDFCASLGFALFLERLLASILRNTALPATRVARIISEELEYSEDNTDAIRLEFLF